MLLNVKRMTQSFLLVSLTLGQFANATLTPTLPKRGQSKTFFDIPNSGGRQEACIIPRFLPGVNYSKNSLEIMQELCSLNFYDTLQVGQKPALICQKDVSTNPGLNIFEVHPNVKENLDCTDVDEEKAKDLIEKAGKYKQSTSCSYTPGILGYFHVSQALGKVNEVPESVLRTFDVKNHLQIIKQALPHITDGTLKSTIGFLEDKLESPANPKWKDVLFVDGLNESFGAFILNPNGEEKFGEMFIRPAAVDVAAANAVLANAQPNLQRAMAFKRAQPQYQLVKNSKSIAALVPPQMSNYDILVNMRDIADMIVIDTIMSQEDRLGNIAYQPFKAVLLQKDTQRKIELLKPNSENKPHRFENKIKDLEKEGYSVVSVDDVKQMILKDNDCSVSRTNVLSLAGLYKEISHIDPKTYQHLLKFNKSLDDAITKDIFRTDFFFTEADFTKMKQNANQVTQKLQERCLSGALNLDLNIEGYMKTGKVAVQTKEDCALKQ